MSTLTQPPHLHDAWDVLASVPFDAIHYHGGQWCPLYALGSSGAYIIPDVIGALREAAGIAEDAGELAEAEDFARAADVLDYLDYLDDRTDREGDERADAIAAELRETYGIDATARNGAVYVASY